MKILPKQILLSLVTIFISFSSLSSLAVAAPAPTPTHDISGALVQGYNATPSVLPGMVVELMTKGSNIVAPLTEKDSDNMLGVIVSGNGAVITLTPETNGTTQPVLVATSGSYPVLVSDQSGAIKTGDYIAMSSIAGIAMKASKDQQNVIGRAEADFNGKNALETTPIKFGSSQPVTVAIGSVPAQIRLAPNPQFHTATVLPGIVIKTVNDIAGKTVSMSQVYLSSAILFLTLFSTGMIYFTGVRSSIVSIGRNPLSKRSVFAGLLKVVVFGLIIFGIGVFASYLLLKS